MRLPLIIAHRGNSSTCVENSLESIRSALSLNVDMIEIDVRLSRDRVLYVIHDKTTGRTAKQNINIEGSTAEDISRIRLKNGEAVPTLTEVLELLSGACGLNIEIKSSGAGELVSEFLLRSGYQGQILLSSFHEEEVTAARRMMPALQTSIIFDNFAIRDVSAYRANGYNVISLRKKTVTKRLIDICHEQGIRVYVWTVDDEHEMKMLINWGVDGIYSNKPGFLKEVMMGSRPNNLSV
jgi:glycerophosphoryl diester phosphodiesterase